MIQSGAKSNCPAQICVQRVVDVRRIYLPGETPGTGEPHGVGEEGALDDGKRVGVGESPASLSTSSNNSGSMASSGMEVPNKPRLAAGVGVKYVEPKENGVATG
jgi:hypothetical protein